MFQLGILIADMHQQCYFMTAFHHTLGNPLSHFIATVARILLGPFTNVIY